MNASITMLILLAIRIMLPIAILFLIGELNSRRENGSSFPLQVS